MATLEENIKQAISDFDGIKAAIKEAGIEVPHGTDTREYKKLVLSACAIEYDRGYAESEALANERYTELEEQFNKRYEKLETEAAKAETEANRKEDGILDRTITKITNDRVGAIGAYSLRGCGKLKSIHFPAAKVIEGYAFHQCSALEDVVFPSVADISDHAFDGCVGLVRANFSELKTIASGAFRNCTSLNALVLCGEAVTLLCSTNAFDNTPVASGRGYIYVPKALMESYKKASNWNVFSEQFRAIEDYPDVTSEFLNLLTDGGFERGTQSNTPEGWNPATLPTWKKQGGVISREAAHAGFNGLLLTGSNVGATHDYINVGDGVTVYLEAMVRSVEGSVDLSVYWQSRWEKSNWAFNNGQWGTVITTERVSTDWTKICGTYTMPEPTAGGLKYSYFAFRFELPSTGGTVYIDDVKVYVVNEALALRNMNIGIEERNNAFFDEWAVKEISCVTGYNSRYLDAYMAALTAVYAGYSLTLAEIQAVIDEVNTKLGV